MVNAVADLVGRESSVCHFHTKIMQKEPRVGGAWEWHQDYGYWYKNGFLYPDSLISVMVALTEATIENGCLQVIKGSHKIGRVEHSFAGDQQGADQAFVDEALRRLEHVYVELQPGDTLFFHPNVLHRSEANNSDNARWSFISCYNLASNRPFVPETHVASYTPLDVVSDQAFIEALNAGVGLRTTSADFWVKDNDLAHKR
jgi:ectoine hydroxylase-related dioxygenase (phytanoyl-CoA dioxygenase family)